MVRRRRLVDEVGEQAGQLVALPGVAWRRGGERVGGRRRWRRPSRRSAAVRAASAIAESRRSTSSARRPARSMSPLSTSSSGSTPSTRRRSSSAIVTPSSRRSSPARHVFSAQPSSWNGRGGRRRGPSGSPPRRPTPRCGRGRRRRGGSGGAPGRGWRSRRPRRRSAGCRRVSSSSATTPRTGWSGAASGRRGGRAGRATRRRRRGSAPRRSSSPEPNVAWISGANVSMSGHMTMTSRGSSVGSSARRWRRASRSTSTWRARPWHEWTWTLWSVGSRSSRRVDGLRERRAGRRRSARTSACSRRSSVRVVGVERVVDVGAGVPAGDELQLAGVAAPRGEQRVLRRGWRCGRRGAVAAVAPAAGLDVLGDALPQHGRRVEQEQVDVARRAEGVEHLDVAGGEAGQPEQRQAGRQVDDVGLVAQPRRTPRQSLGRAGRADALTEEAPQRRLPGDVRRQRPRRVRRCRRRRPRRRSARAGGRRSGRTGRRGGGRRRTGGRAAARRRRSGPPRWAASGASHSSSRCSSTTSSSGHTARSGSHGSSSGSMPVAAASAVPTSRPGNGNSMLAHTPSWRPGDVPSTSTGAG